VPVLFIEERTDRVALAEADFEGKQATGDECGVGLRDESAVDGEAVGSSEEREMGFMVADFGGEGGCVGE